ncbi:MAG: 3,4-dihydroxy-2-butanone-4-phosphate synthase [Phycisphaerales bacterium]|nr:3,4-dihydroxy-2-butanone-4-phosphate synthase [Phycisphaerales bacterium]
MTNFASIPEILDELRAGRMIVLVDDEARENEGDLVCAAQFVAHETINTLTRLAGGYLCVAMDGANCDRLALSPQAGTNSSLRGTAFTVSVDGHPRHGVGTGISARDRATTIRLLADASTRPDDLVRPGHINPLRARDGGVLVRTGQTEGSVDLCRLAGLTSAACIIEVVREDGEMARMDDLLALCAKHALKMCSVEQIIEYRLRQETLVTRIEPAAGVEIETPEGPFTLFAWHSSLDPQPHLALCLGGVGALHSNGSSIEQSEPVLVRMHRRDILGDIFAVTRGAGQRTGQETLRASLRAIRTTGRGALVYLRSEMEGCALTDTIHQVRRSGGDDVNAPDLTRQGGVAARAQPMDQREFGIGGQILRDLGLRKLRVLSDHQKAMPGLHGFGLEIVEYVPIA